MRKGNIYIIKNRCNDKVYIGQTIQSVSDRFKQHLKPSTLKKRGTYKIYNAISKYGKENFYCEVLESDVPYAQLDEREIYYISKYNSYNKGYNSTSGGDCKTICKIQDVELLVKMFKEGKTQEEISKVFNVNKITIQRTLHSMGYRKNATISKEFLLKNKDVMTNKQIADKFGVSSATVTRAFQRFNIKRGKGSSNHLNKQNQKQIK